jgi:excisionase family DNA binding protein
MDRPILKEDTMDVQQMERVSETEEPLVYSVPEVANLLGISRAFAYELVGRGEIPVMRLGRRCLIPKSALHELLEIRAIPGSGS